MSAPRGYFALVLHAHLPFVRHPEHERFLEERWLYEAITETYLPLLWILDQLADDGIHAPFSMSLTPTLVSMLDDELLGRRFERHLRELVELAEKEVVRMRHQPALLEVAEFYRKRYGLLLEYWRDRCGGRPVDAFRAHQDAGRIEILASAATHGFLPLLRHEPGSVRAQVGLGVEAYSDRFGRPPRGFWLPECGFYPGLDEVLAENGVRWFCLESHGVLHGSSRPVHGVFAPVVCPSGVTAFARDPECSKQVWSQDEGFPGDPDYREFYHDIGFHLPLEYIGPFSGPDGIRTQTGIKYHRITGPTDAKEPYVRGNALRKTAEHAQVFLEWRERQVEHLAERLERPPLVVAPYDAELFGHWWFEGPEWIHQLLRRMARSKVVEPITPSEFLERQPDCQESEPAASTWGDQGYNDVWLNGDNDSVWPRIHDASARMSDLARRFRAASGLRRRALDQAARELVLAQASDWPFILRMQTATGYARQRIDEHLEAFDRLAGEIESDVIHPGRLDTLCRRSTIFPRMRYELFEATMETHADARIREPAHVAFLSAEMTPLVKVGGLADVVGALPGALAAQGVHVTVVLPAYQAIDRRRFHLRTVHEGLSARLGGHDYGFGLLEADSPGHGVRLLLVERNDLFGHREGIYVDPATKKEYPDTALRFAFFTKAALEALRAVGEAVDVVHSHDHQTALASLFVKRDYPHDPVLARAACVYTLHNLGYQGVYDPDVLELIGATHDEFHPGSDFEHYGKVNWMKLGIRFADKVSTVSRTYAREIREDPVQSAGLGGVLEERREDLVGILNGIDVDEWNPATDELIPAHFHAGDLDGKRRCKQALLDEAGLDPDDVDSPLIGVISRLVDQKGLDLVQESFERILGERARLVVLGTGLEKYEEFIEDAAKRHPRRVAALIRFDNGLAHRIEAGADLFLMPSLYEPCGLNQMYSLRYGTIPIVRATGGLADTVQDADEHEDGVGFAFTSYSSEALVDAVERALAAYDDAPRWRAIVERAMRRDNSWGASAAEYVDLYRAAMTRV